MLIWFDLSWSLIALNDFIAPQLFLWLAWWVSWWHHGHGLQTMHKWARHVDAQEPRAQHLGACSGLCGWSSIGDEEPTRTRWFVKTNKAQAQGCGTCWCKWVMALVDLDIMVRTGCQSTQKEWAEHFGTLRTSILSQGSSHIRNTWHHDVSMQIPDLEVEAKPHMCRHLCILTPAATACFFLCVCVVGVRHKAKQAITQAPAGCCVVCCIIAADTKLQKPKTLCVKCPLNMNGERFSCRH